MTTWPSIWSILSSNKQKRLFSCSLTAFLAIAAHIPALADVSDGMRLAERVHERPDGQDAVSRGTMTLRDPGQSPRVRETVNFRLERDDGTELSLIRFRSPADIEGTGLLMHEHPDGETDQWLYLPALNRVRRIASGRRGGRFVGSDLLYEDLEDRAPELDQHKVLGEEEIQDTTTTVLESIPRDESSSVYTKRVRWIHEQTLIPLRIDYYQDGNEPVKRMTVQRIERIQGYWTVFETTIEDLDSGHKTILATDEIVYDQGIPESIFTDQSLQDPGFAMQYRP